GLRATSAHRYPSMNELLTELGTHLAGRRWGVASALRRRRRPAVLLAGGAMLAIGGVAVFVARRPVTHDEQTPPMASIAPATSVEPAEAPATSSEVLPTASTEVHAPDGARPATASSGASGRGARPDGQTSGRDAGTESQTSGHKRSTSPPP